MKLKTVLFSVSLVLLGSFGTLLLTSFRPQGQESKPSVQKPNPEEMQKMMQAFLEAAKTGPMHKKLAEGAGEWIWDTVSYMGPGGAPMKSQMKVHAHSILGGRFLVEEVEGKTMGQSFKGVSITGFDNVRKEYQSLWMDSMSTRMTLSTGKQNDKGEVHFSGTMVDVVSPKGRPFRSVTLSRGKDHHEFKMFDSIPGTKKEFLVMTVSAKRVK